jgi:hypothetical protein
MKSHKICLFDMIVMQGTKTINKQIKIEAHMSLSYSHEIIKSYAECNQFR